MPGHADPLPATDEALALEDYVRSVPPGWNFGGMEPAAPWLVGERRDDAMRDRIETAGALVRMTYNQAMAHRDPAASPYDQPLDYGGHVIGLAQASLSRLCRGLATVIGWHSCDHVAPAFEGDVVEFSHELLAEQPVGGGMLRAFAVMANRAGTDPPARLLTWVPIVVVAPVDDAG